MFEKIMEAALQLMFPRVCPSCGEILSDKERAEENPFICKYCYEKLAFIKDPYCIQCGAPLQDSADAYCKNCLQHERFFDQGAALLLHDEQAKKMLYDLKFANKRDNVDFFGLEAAKRLGKSIRLWDPEVIIPVPLHKRRQFERGFNQAALLSESLSKNLEQLYGLCLPVDQTYLIRNRKTKPQKELDHDKRAENVKDKFLVNTADKKHVSSALQKNAAPKGSRFGDGRIYSKVLLLDDIFTSGATVNECAKVLKESGTENVYFLAMSAVG